MERRVARRPFPVIVYVMCRDLRMCARAGVRGVGFYIRRGLNVRTLTVAVDPRFESIEQMWIATTLNGKRVTIGTAYRPPWLNLDLFLAALTDTLTSLDDTDHFILLGDFNVNLLNGSDNRTRVVMDFLGCLSLSQIVTAPTHFTESSESLIDLVCTNLRAKNVTVEPCGSRIGHAVIICRFCIRRDKLQPYLTRYRPFKYINTDDLNKSLMRIDWNYILSLTSMNEMVDIFNRCVLAVFDAHAPIKTCLIKEPSLGNGHNKMYDEIER
ncbi:unnamed protein product [Arctia plantaginis]|uniref:Endonuclease/exonuclease/phosphatase domain-containing protein n=1 Tax=Arctia plantaginis TaxID=874455 RepID=A0A8S0Z3C3_ARCPL|nr:unnamed protein product [Arctia plantaginis]